VQCRRTEPVGEPRSQSGGHVLPEPAHEAKEQLAVAGIAVVNLHRFAGLVAFTHVGEHVQAAKFGELRGGAEQEPGTGGAAFVGEDLGVGEAGMVVDRGVLTSRWTKNS
jgi:hypothetical protein